MGGKRGYEKTLSATSYFQTQPPLVQEWCRLGVEALSANPSLAISKLAKVVGCPDRELFMRAMCLAALDELYPSRYSEDPARQVRKIKDKNRRALRTMMDTGDSVATAKASGWSEDRAVSHLNALLAHYATQQAKEYAAATAATLRQAAVSDKLTDLVLGELDFEGTMQKAMQNSRMELARGLYVKSKVLWERVMVFAQLDVVDRFTAQMIRALTEAASTAVKDAQLLSGQATDRVEGFVKAFQQMSDDELLSFVQEDVTIREIHERELKPREEVTDAEYTVQG